jgi:NADPH:quinone reductase-like Zn-dependent oxidoreductase
MDTKGKGEFTGKIAFVTGAGSGIGRAAALAFAREGASVVVADVSEKDTQETARMIEEKGGRALAVRCDVTRVEDVKRGPIEEIRPGDVVWFSPGEEHWHGATPTTAMTHIAIQESLNGKVVDWMEHVTEQQYRK